MNAFCVKAALSVVGRAPGRLRAGAEEGPASGKSVSAAFDLVSSRVHRRWMVHGGGGRCECGASEVSDGMTDRPTERETEGEEAERAREGRGKFEIRLSDAPKSSMCRRRRHHQRGRRATLLHCSKLAVTATARKKPTRSRESGLFTI